MAETSIPTVPSSATPPAPPEAVAPGAYHGWNAWRTAVNVTLSAQLQQAEHVRQRTVNVLSGIV